MKKPQSILFLMFFSILIIAFFILNYFTVYYEPKSSESTLVKYFGLSKANIENSEIYFWYKTKTVSSELTDLNKITGEFSKELKLSLNSNPVSYKGNSTQIEINGILKNNIIDTKTPVNVCIKAGETKEMGVERTISVDINLNKSFSELYKIKKLVLEVFKKHKMEPEINSCITGSFNGKMSIPRMKELCNNVFTQAEAKKVEGMEDENLISETAYSPNIDNFIKVSGKQINLSLAMRYKTTENKTYIWLATPIITTEY